LPKSAVDVIGPAFEHTRKQLFEPFRLGQWARLALLALATGEMSTGNGCNSGVTALSSLPSRLPHPSQNFVDPGDVWSRLGLDPAVLVTMVVVIVVGFVVLGLVWLYVSSVSRFLLFQSVLRKDCELGECWGRWQEQGLHYFAWQLVLSFVGMGVAAILFVPLLLPVLVALIKNHEAPGLGLVVALLPMIFVFTLFGLLMALIGLLTKDFVVPIMAIDRVGVVEGWRHLLRMMKAQKTSYAGYVGMKIVLAVGASFVMPILWMTAVAIALILVGIPVVMVVLLARAGGLSWNAGTITLAIVVGTFLLGGLLYVIALVCVPVAVFFAAYAMYFFAERYPALHALLYPPPSVPPPVPPLPESIG
jgi:MFS family permease